MKRFAHWTPTYVRHRLAEFASRRLRPDTPWLTRDAVRFLDLWLQPEDRVFEWGSGRSTTWFASRVRRVVAVEHDIAWHEGLSRIIGEKQITNVELHQASIAEGYAKDYLRPWHERKEAFDLVLIDGRLRDSCFQAVLDDPDPAAVIVLDNAERYLQSNSKSPEKFSGEQQPPWSAIERAMASRRRIWTSNGVSDTAIFVPVAAG